MPKTDVHSLLHRRIQRITANGGSLEEAMSSMREYLEQERQSKIGAQNGSVIAVNFPARLAE